MQSAESGLPQSELAQFAADLVKNVRQLVLSGQNEAAVAMATEFVELMPNAPKAHALLSQARLSAGNRAGADTAQWRAVELVADQIAKTPRPLSLQTRMSTFGHYIFIGGPPQQFVASGELQLQTLVAAGLRPEHTLLDIGCGCLRAGVHLMAYLNPGNYFGIEPNDIMLRFGKVHVVGETLLTRWNPSFDNNTDFDFTVFEKRFDFFVARSIWTHASKPQIETMLDSFAATAAPGAVFLTSLYLASTEEQDYNGEGWAGRSESSAIGRCIRHDPHWIVAACTARDLIASRPDAPIANGQVWLQIQRV